MDLPPATEIVVTGTRLAGAPADQAFSVTTVGHDALDYSERLDDALITIPGVTLFRRGDSSVDNPTVQGLSVRGMGPSGAGRSLVLLDGIPQGDPFGGWVIWGALTPLSIDGAAIVRGAGAGPYGAGALTGTVELHERQTPGAVLEPESGERDHERATAFADFEFGRANVMLAGNSQSDNGWFGVRSGRGAADQPFWSNSRAAAAQLSLENGDVAISARLNAYDEARGVVVADRAVVGEVRRAFPVGAPDLGVTMADLAEPAPGVRGPAVGGLRCCYWWFSSTS